MLDPGHAVDAARLQAPTPRTRSRWRLFPDARIAPAVAGRRASAPSGPTAHPALALRLLKHARVQTRAVGAGPANDAWPNDAWTDDLAGTFGRTHASCMQTQTKTQIVGFMELQVGSLAVQVPIRAAEPTPALPLASFEVEGENYAILIRGDSASKAVERAMGDAAKEAVAHLSRKLLN
jgi:hypothetical protein